MQIQINTDKNIRHDESVVRHVHQSLEPLFERYAGQVTRVEVHLHDTNADKKGDNDKHCLVEARLEGRPPVVASENAQTLAAAISGAAKKLQRRLSHDIGKLH